MKLTVVVSKQSDCAYRASVEELDISAVGATFGGAIRNVCNSIVSYIDEIEVNGVDAELALSYAGINLTKLKPGDTELV